MIRQSRPVLNSIFHNNCRSVLIPLIFMHVKGWSTHTNVFMAGTNRETVYMTSKESSGSAMLPNLLSVDFFALNS